MYRTNALDPGCLEGTKRPYDRATDDHSSRVPSGMYALYFFGRLRQRYARYIPAFRHWSWKVEVGFDSPPMYARPPFAEFRAPVPYRASKILEPPRSHRDFVDPAIIEQQHLRVQML